MELMRRCLPHLATFLAVLIIVQMTDVIACADEAEAAEVAAEAHADAFAETHEALAHGDAHDHDDETAADCLCHIVFAPTTVFPTLGGRPAPEALPLAMAMDTPPEVEQDGLDPVPLG